MNKLYGKGIHLTHKNPEFLASFYSQVFSAPIEKEDYGDLEIHYGLDIGGVHLGIHPPNNLEP